MKIEWYSILSALINRKMKLGAKLSVLFSVLLCVILVGCDRSLKIDHRALLETSSINLSAEEQFLLVVPQNGCSTCVKKAYNFILDNYQNASVKYIFTHYSSKKAVKIRFRVLGIEDHSRLNFIDLGVAKSFGVSLFYPTLIQLDQNGDLKKASLMNAEDSSDWEELTLFIAE